MKSVVSTNIFCRSRVVYIVAAPKNENLVSNMSASVYYKNNLARKHWAYTCFNKYSSFRRQREGARKIVRPRAIVWSGEKQTYVSHVISLMAAMQSSSPEWYSVPFDMLIRCCLQQVSASGEVDSIKRYFENILQQPQWGRMVFTWHVVWRFRQYLWLARHWMH